MQQKCLSLQIIIAHEALLHVTALDNQNVVKGYNNIRYESFGLTIAKWVCDGKLERFG